REALPPAEKVVTRELPVVMMRPASAAAFHSTFSAFSTSARSSLVPYLNAGSVWADAGPAATITSAPAATMTAMRAISGRLGRGAGLAAPRRDRDVLEALGALLGGGRRRLLLVQRAHELHHHQEEDQGDDEELQ